MSLGRLYIVATPIGNLQDITFRAVSVLSSVDTIFCEDTRVTAKLLAHYKIQTRMVSLNARTEKAKIAHVLKLLEEGRDVAFVSDAGTPGISDPGSLLVSSVRGKLSGVSVVAVPGASALTAALSISGLPSSEFLFLGFLPHKKGREKLFGEIAQSKRTVVFYESPHRIMKTFEKLALTLDSSRTVVVGRELTKMYEQVISGNSKEVLDYFMSHKDKQRGEFVVSIRGVR